MKPVYDIRLKPEILAEYQLPDVDYPVPLSVLDSVLLGDGTLPFAEILAAFQERSRNGETDWKAFEPAMERLTQLIAPPDERAVITAAGDNWWLEIGPVDLDAEIITIQRGDDLIAAIGKRDDGRLRVAVFRPLDGKSAACLIAVGQIPNPQYGVCMRENNWEYALDSSAGTGNAYAYLHGAAYLSYWEKGIGILHDGEVEPVWRAMKDLTHRPVVYAAVELGVYYSLSGADEADCEASPEEHTPTDFETPCFWTGKRQQSRTVRGRFLGCLLGGAVGDALGAPVEFMRHAEIVKKFGPRGITDYATAYRGIGTITDDTQMTLFTAEGLIRARVRHCFKGMANIASVIDHAYQRWLLTQSERSPQNFTDNSVDGWLFQHPELHSQRAPGNTCLSALKAKQLFGEPAKNNSKGCGGVMRVAPIGLGALRMGNTPEQTFCMGAEIAGLTHGHPTSSLSSGFLAVLIHALVDGLSLPEGLRVAKNILRKQDFHEETLSILETAEKLAASSLTPQQCITRLGEGWIAEEALGISIYCTLVARNFKQGVILAVNHSGDSDSTGAITGNILGAMHGIKSIPDSWLERLELRTVITELAEDLYDFIDWNIGKQSKNTELNERIWTKYPGW